MRHEPAAAQAAQQHNRSGDGRYAEEAGTDPGHVDLDPADVTDPAWTSEKYLSPRDRELFTDEAWTNGATLADVDHHRWVANRSSLIATRRMADRVCHLWPDAETAILTANRTDEATDLVLSGIRLNDGTTVEIGDDSPLRTETLDDSRSIDPNVHGWQNTCREISDDRFVVDLAEAGRIDGIDLEEGRYDPVRTSRLLGRR